MRADDWQLSILAVIAAGWLLSPTTMRASGPPPPVLAKVSQRGEGVYQAVLVGEWGRARVEAQSLAELVSKLVMDNGDFTCYAKPLAKLARAVYGKDRINALRASNKISLRAAEQGFASAPADAAQVEMLDCYGRELQIGAEAGDRAEMRKAAANIHRCWELVRSLLLARGVDGPVSQFDGFVEQIDPALENPEQTAALAKQLLEVVERFEQALPF